MHTPIAPVNIINTAQVIRPCQLKKNGATSASTWPNPIQTTTGQSIPCLRSSAAPAPGTGIASAAEGNSKFPSRARSEQDNLPLVQRESDPLFPVRGNTPIVS